MLIYIIRNFKLLLNAIIYQPNNEYNFIKFKIYKINSLILFSI
jgi:hypothetical protein